MRQRIVILRGIAVAIVILDQVAKTFALRHLSMGIPVPVVEGLAALTLVLNPGLAFGILRRLGPEHWWLMALLAIAAVALLVHVAVQMLPGGGRVLAAGFGLILGGAAGNIIDRIRLGGVVDFIDLSWGPYHWPAFNTADAALSIGVVILLRHVLVSGPAPTAGDRPTPQAQKEASR